MTGSMTGDKTAGAVRHRLLFACLGNICRSPMAEGVFRRVAEEEGVGHLFEIDSAGMGDWHKGQAPDHRAQKAALARGADISDQSARKVELEDFEYFDLILAMDASNIADLPADIRGDGGEIRAAGNLGHLPEGVDRLHH